MLVRSLHNASNVGRRTSNFHMLCSCRSAGKPQTCALDQVRSTDASRAHCDNPTITVSMTNKEQAPHTRRTTLNHKRCPHHHLEAKICMTELVQINLVVIVRINKREDVVHVCAGLPDRIRGVRVDVLLCCGIQQRTELFPGHPARGWREAWPR